MGQLTHAASSILSAASLEATLQQAVDLAAATIDACDFAGIVLLESASSTTWVHSDPLIEGLHGLQQRLEEGPCLDAILARSTIYADDFVDEIRWPNFSPEAVIHGIRSVFALYFPGDVAPGALCLYARYPQAFGVFDRGKAAMLASLASLAIGKALAEATQKREISTLEAGLTSRAVIGQAQGILMERERLTADQAFDVLRRASQRFNRKLREVAQELVDTGESPKSEETSKDRSR
jgi:hypothetical protein